MLRRKLYHVDDFRKSHVIDLKVFYCLRSYILNVLHFFVCSISAKDIVYIGLRDVDAGEQ